MHRQLVNIVSMTDEEYEDMMLAMPQQPLAARHARIAVAGNFPVPTLAYPNTGYQTTPWRHNTCALCSSELDCRLLDEYCGSDGCCHKGECVSDDDCVEQDAINQYYRIDGFDSLGSDINPLNPQNSVSVTQTLCDVNPSCVGFNSYGLLKHNIRSPDLWTPQPPVQGLVPWSLYIKKTATTGKNPKVKLPHGMKQFCNLTIPPSEKIQVPIGICRQCIGCKKDEDCPDATVCSSLQGCCVNNPCYNAVAENGKWVDGSFSRQPQCDCPASKPHCCLKETKDLTSAFCSETPCEKVDKLRACKYICEDPQRKFDAVMCLGNQRCCNSSGGPPVCCAADQSCGTGNKCSPTR